MALFSNYQIIITRTCFSLKKMKNYYKKILNKKKASFQNNHLRMINDPDIIHNSGSMSVRFHFCISIGYHREPGYISKKKKVSKHSFLNIFHIYQLLSIIQSRPPYILFIHKSIQNN